MSFALFTLFYSKILKPTAHYRFSFIVFVFLFYLFFGSYVHFLLNSHVEFEERLKLTEYINEFYENHPCIEERKAKEFLDFILNASNVNGIVLGQNGHKDTMSYPPSWKFGGETIFFTFTLLSTIGYGYLTPSTDNGKLFCVFYILIGVPLTFLILYNLAERIEYAITGYVPSHQPRNIHSMNESEITRTYFPSRKRINSAYLKLICVGFFLIVFVYILPSIAFSSIMEYPSWSFLDALYYCYISISTVGFGDFIPGRGLDALSRDNYRLAMTVYLFIGIILNIVFTNLLMRLPIARMISDSLTNQQFNYTHLSDDIEENENQNLLNNSTNSPINATQNFIEEDLLDNSICVVTSRNTSHASNFLKTKII